MGELNVPHGTTWPLTLIELRLDDGNRFDVPVPAGERAFAYVVSGTAEIGIEGQAVASGDVAWLALSHPGEASTLQVVARDAVRLLVYASPVIDEPIALGGPFVMNTAQEIQQAFEDLRAGRLTTASPCP